LDSIEYRQYDIELLIRILGSVCGARKLAEQEQGATLPTSTDESPVDARRKANWARLIQQV